MGAEARHRQLGDQIGNESVKTELIMYLMSGRIQHIKRIFSSISNR